MPTVVAIYAGKGGIGKTTTATNLAYLLGRDNGRTVLVDANPEQPSASVIFDTMVVDAPYALAVEEHPERLRNVKNLDADYVVIDCPPSRREAQGALDVADLVIVPYVAKFLETRAIMATVREVFGGAVSTRRYAILFVSLERAQITEAEHARQALTGLGAPVFATQVRKYKAHERAQATGLPIVEPEAMARFDKGEKAGQDYIDTRDELLRILNKR